jgi:hypothetical protein
MKKKVKYTTTPHSQMPASLTNDLSFKKLLLCCVEYLLDFPKKMLLVEKCEQNVLKNGRKKTEDRKKFDQVLIRKKEN